MGFSLCFAFGNHFLRAFLFISKGVFEDLDCLDIPKNSAISHYKIMSSQIIIKKIITKECVKTLESHQ